RPRRHAPGARHGRNKQPPPPLNPPTGPGATTPHIGAATQTSTTADALPPPHPTRNRGPNDRTPLTRRTPYECSAMTPDGEASRSGGDTSTVGHASLLRLGDRVVVSPAYQWSRGATAVVAAVPPDVAAGSPGWRDCWRTVKTLQGKQVFYWVVFDEPQVDADGDGPYNAAEIPGHHLTGSP